MQFLKKISNGRVFDRTDILAKEKGFVECDADGNILLGHVGDANSLEASENHRVTKYLGNQETGALFDYTPLLAGYGSLTPIDSKEQWALMQETGEAAPLQPDTIAPALQRRSAQVEQSEKAEIPEIPEVNVPHETVESESILPNITGLGARESKSLLSEFIKKHYKVKIDLRMNLENFVKECERIVRLDDSKKTATGM